MSEDAQIAEAIAVSMELGVEPRRVEGALRLLRGEVRNEYYILMAEPGATPAAILADESCLRVRPGPHHAEPMMIHPAPHALSDRVFRRNAQWRHSPSPVDLLVGCGLL